MLRKALRAIGWTAAGLVGFVVVLYLLVLAINWRDREPSATAVRLTQLFDNRAAIVGPDDAPASLANAEQRDPYTDRPFEWDGQRRAIVFRGLTPGERGEHPIYY